jgi:hypothetical protein
LIACWIEIFGQLYVRSKADVWSGNIRRQKRDESIDDMEGFSYKRKKFKLNLNFEK